jgi:hypothetical protein
MKDYTDIYLIGKSLTSMVHEIEALRSEVQALTAERNKYERLYNAAARDCDRLHQTWCAHIMNGEVKFAEPVNPSKVNDQF